VTNTATSKISSGEARNGSGGYFGARRGAWFYGPSELAADHVPGQLQGQYVVARGETLAPKSWRRRTVGGWTLHHDELVPAVDVLDGHGSTVGWLVGHPVDVAAARLLQGSAVLPSGSDDATPVVDRFRSWVGELGGRFVAVLADSSPHAWVDAYGSFPLFYHAAGERLSSSPFLVHGPGEPVIDSPLVERLDLYGTRHFYPFAQTSQVGVSRLVASHELEMTRFEQRRVWPRGPFAPVGPEEAVEVVGAVTEAIITAFVEAGPTVMGLTAGADSRAMLASARRVSPDLRFATLPQPDLVGKTDVATATTIATTLGLDHVVPKMLPASDADVRLWFYRTGAVAGDARGRSLGPTLASLGAGERPFRLSGVGMELGRGWVWTHGRQPTPRNVERSWLTPEYLLGKMNTVSSAPALLEEAAEWLEMAPDLGVLDTLDLCALETVFGAWIGALSLAYPDAFAATILPFSHRSTLEAMFGLPHDYRAADRLPYDVIDARWPELSRFPVNNIPRRARAGAKIHRVARMPGGVVRRIRRRRLNKQRSRAASTP
jgi:hypothetical protein